MKKKQLLKNTIIIFIGKVCTQFISFLLLPLYTSYLTTKDYGVVDLITSYITLFVPIITLELEMSIFRYLVDSRKDKKEEKKLITNNFYILIISLLIFSILYFIITSFFTVPYRLLIYIDFLVCTLSGNFLQVARGVGDTVGYSISCIVTGLTTVIMNIFLIVVCHLSAFGMILSMTIANGLCSLFLFIRLKLYRKIDWSLKDKSLRKSMRKYSIPLIPNGVSWWIVNISDRTIITYVLGAAANGVYAVSNKFPTILSSLLGIFNLSWSESAALHINSDDRDEFFSDIANTVIKLFSSLGVLMIACMPFVFPILINHKYNDAYNYIPILVFAAVCNVVICLYSGIYIALKDTKKVASTSILGAIINILVNVLFIKKFGLYAAAMSTFISYFVMMIYRHIDVAKDLKLKYEKGLILKIGGIFLIACLLYYQKNIIIDVLNLVIIFIFAWFLNRNFIKSVYFSLKQKIFKKRVSS